MDPVVELASRIRDAEAALKAACEWNQVAYAPGRAEAIVRSLAAIRGLYEEFSRTSPISQRGAGEQLRFAAERLPYSHIRHAQDLNRIAERFAADRSTSADLIWLRALHRSLLAASCGATRDVAAGLLGSAVGAVARPVVIHRSASPARPRVACLPRLEEDRTRAMHEPAASQRAVGKAGAASGL